MTVRTVLIAFALILGLSWSTVAQQAQTPLRTPDVIFVPTPQEVVDVMLKIAKVTKNDVVYDLGSGDGRIPITAARVYGAKAVGIDIDPDRIREANENVKAAASADRGRSRTPSRQTSAKPGSSSSPRGVWRRGPSSTSL